MPPLSGRARRIPRHPPPSYRSPTEATNFHKPQVRILLPAIEMVIGDWHVDELGVRTREITARE